MINMRHADDTGGGGSCCGGGGGGCDGGCSGGDGDGGRGGGCGGGGEIGGGCGGGSAALVVVFPTRRISVREYALLYIRVLSFWFMFCVFTVVPILTTSCFLVVVSMTMDSYYLSFGSIVLYELVKIRACV